MIEAIQQSLNPVETKLARVLILGTAPGPDSLSAHQYYARSGNLFWGFMSNLFDLQSSASYEERVRFLNSIGVALWDMAYEFRRQGSSDAKLKVQTYNNIQGFLQAHPDIRCVFFNGTWASKHFRRYKRAVRYNPPSTLKFCQLPSTSSAPGRYVKRPMDKLEDWQAVRACLDGDEV